MLSTMLLADAVKVNKGGPGSGPRPGKGSLNNIQAYRENPGDNQARGQVTLFAAKTVKGGEYDHLHPGEITVYRAGSAAGNRGQSWTKSRVEASRHTDASNPRISSLKLTRNDPAIDMNRADPGSRYSNEREVFVDMRNIDRSRFSKV